MLLETRASMKTKQQKKKGKINIFGISEIYRIFLQVIETYWKNHMVCCFYPPLTLTHGIVIILSNNLLEIIIVLFDRDVYIAKYRYIDTDIWIQK